MTWLPYALLWLPALYFVVQIIGRERERRRRIRAFDAFIDETLRNMGPLADNCVEDAKIATNAVFTPPIARPTDTGESDA